MRTTENQPKAPRLSIEGGGKTYSVDLSALSDFLDLCQEKLDVYSVTEIQTNIQTLTDMVIDGVDETGSAGAFKKPLQFLRSLELLFMALLYERKGGA